MIGEIPEPAGFRYREAFLKGAPRHTKTDPFRARHPRMDAGRRAKIFAPFDALRGFSAAVLAKDVPYVFKQELGEDEQEELDRRLRVLRGLTATRRLARASRVTVSVSCYIPCGDEDSESYGYRGLYETFTGICMGIEAGFILVDEDRLPLEDIRSVDSPDGIFERGAEDEPA